jgi:hypothetical protein
MRKNYPALFRFANLALLAFTFCHANISAQSFTDSNLPIIIITTDLNPGTGEPFDIPDDPRVLASMKIIERPDGSRNYMDDQNTASFLDYDGRINIEIRGSSSQVLPKKPYGLTTLEADNMTNNNVELLGMPSENDWVLNSLAFDPSLLRDYLSYNLSRQIAQYAARTKYCEVVINGEYRGLYVLQEKIKADSDRVNILKIADSDDSLPNITGGYITKSDKLTGDDPVAWSMSSYNGGVDFVHDLPKPENVTSQQDSYIHSVFTSLAGTSHSNNTSLSSGYPSIIDIPTFVDFMLLNELGSNADAYQFSTYFHKDRLGKLRAGPIWDFNLTYGNDLFVFGLDRSHYDVWQFDNGDNTGAKFWRDLFNNSAFKCYMSRRWNELTQPDMPFKHNSLVEFIDVTVANISEGSVRENEKWGTVPNLATEIENLKLFLYNRINWMTANIGTFNACSDIAIPPLVITKINYNPSVSGNFPVSNDQEFVEIKNTGAATVNLTGIYLRELGLSYQFPPNSTVGAGQSIFLASNPDTFQLKYGISAFGQYTRNLSNSHYKIVLADGFGNTIDTVEYFDDAPWPDADGNGSFLELIDTSLDNNLASSWIASTATLASEQFSTASNFSLYPNPVHDFLTIDTTGFIDSIEIFDIYGKRLDKIVSDVNILTLDFRKYPVGMYFVQIVGNGASTTRKIIRN